jgi:tRNA pseudouridine55 synthase
MQQKRPKRLVNGVLLLDKPAGFSSNQALQCAKRLYTAAKAGHTGSLDPMATGLLPVCFGEATKFSHYLLEADKTYYARVKLGVTTTTGDKEGEVLQRVPVAVSRRDVESVLPGFLGKISQVPPMYSALKHQGKALYEYARAGVVIERAAREVTIHSIALNGMEDDELDIIVACSKGTYIRTLAEDIGAALGCGAHLVGLRRVKTGAFDLTSAYTLEQLEQMTLQQRDACLLAADCLIAELPAVEFDDESAYYLRRGQPVWKSGVVGDGMLRLYGPQQVFLGVGERLDDGQIAPRRLMV